MNSDSFLHWKKLFRTFLVKTPSKCSVLYKNINFYIKMITTQEHQCMNKVDLTSYNTVFSIGFLNV